MDILHIVHSMSAIPDEQCRAMREGGEPSLIQDRRPNIVYSSMIQASTVETHDEIRW